jgi:hypothetical protein
LKFVVLSLRRVLAFSRTLDFPALPFGPGSPFSARWIFLRSPLDQALPFSGTLDFPTLPFRPGSPLFGHAGLSNVTFWTRFSPFRVRWIFLRYLLVRALHSSGTLDFPTLPFGPSSPLFGHAGFSSVTFWTGLSTLRARWIFQRYLLVRALHSSGTVNFPALPFRPGSPLFGHGKFSSVTF